MLTQIYVAIWRHLATMIIHCDLMLMLQDISVDKSTFVQINIILVQIMARWRQTTYNYLQKCRFLVLWFHRASPLASVLTHCGLMMPYGDMELEQHKLRSVSSLAQVMTCCLTAPSLSQCCLIMISEVLWHSHENKKVWWLCLVPTSTPRFASDVGYRMAKI